MDKRVSRRCDSMEEFLSEIERSIEYFFLQSEGDIEEKRR